jgi:hypothetical protein
VRVPYRETNALFLSLSLAVYFVVWSKLLNVMADGSKEPKKEIERLYTHTEKKFYIVKNIKAYIRN